MGPAHRKPRRTRRDKQTAPRRGPFATGLLVWYGLGGAGLPLLLASTPVWAQVRPAPGTLPTAPVTQYGAAIDYKTSGNTAVITQTAPTNIVTWNSFDIGAGARVTVKQPSANATLLNKVEGGGLTPTMIDGLLSANGRVYIYNPNGVVFGKGSQVNVNALVASSLKFDEARVKGGLVMPGTTPVLGVADGTGAGAVRVEAGATLSAATGGLLMLAAPNVVNNGSLSAPDGQVVLAAGNKVYLASPDENQAKTLRGLLVEVSNDPATAAPGVASRDATGVAENGTTGAIDVGRGNATMIGYAVNQKGLVSATTSLDLNGSIYLYARDQARNSGANSGFVAQRSGAVVLGENSTTSVLPQLDDIVAFVRAERPDLPAGLTPAAAMDVFQTLPADRRSAFLSARPTAPASPAFKPSEVKVEGLSIDMRNGAAIVAPNGNVRLDAKRLELNLETDAATNNGVQDIDPLTTAARIDLAPGSRIDVSGSAGTPMAMESNVITVDLRGTELADNPVLRDSPLYASKARIDIRNGDKAAGGAANVSGWLALVQQNLGQLTAAGGTVAINAEGAVIQRTGSSINVSGGWVDYLSGYVNTSKFVHNDVAVDIAKSTANTAYSAIVDLPNSAAMYETGYRQGASAGKVQISAPVMALGGRLLGTTSPGVRQRDVGAAGFPSGATLEIGTLSFGYGGNVTFGKLASVSALPAPGKPFLTSNKGQAALATGIVLDADTLAGAGFSNIVAQTFGNIEVAAPVTLAPGGRLDLNAGASIARTSGGVLQPGGNISIRSDVTVPGGKIAATAKGNVKVADGVDLDVAGRWTNDGTGASLDADGYASGALALNGGTVNLTVASDGLGLRTLEIGSGVAIDASAGAWRDTSGKTAEGKAGSITVAAKANNLTVPSPVDAELRLAPDATFAAYGFGTGGALNLTGRNVTLGPVARDAQAADLTLPSTFFQQGGFTNYTISANVNLDVAPGAVITPRARSWALRTDAGTQSSGSMARVATSILLPLAGGVRNRPTTNLTLKAAAAPPYADDKRFDAGHLTVGEGAALLLDPLANLDLVAGEQITVFGTLVASGGHIGLNLPTALPGGNGASNFRPERSIWFGPNAQVLAGGSTARMTISADGIATGEPIAGGTIEIGDRDQSGNPLGVNGYVIAEKGSVFDVGGIFAGVLSMKAGNVVAPPQEVSSAGGKIAIRTKEGLLFDGSVAGAGGGHSAGGELDISLFNGGDALNPRILNVTDQGVGSEFVPSGLKPGDDIVVHMSAHDADQTDLGWYVSGSLPSSVFPKRGGEGWMSASAINAGRFGKVDLKGPDGIAFGLGSDDRTLKARDSLILDTPLLLADVYRGNTQPGQPGHTLTLAAPYVRLGSGDNTYQLDNYLIAGANYRAGQDDVPTEAPAKAGNAVLVTRGTTTVDLIGNGATRGFADVTLAAKSDIRLIGLAGGSATNSRDGYATGSFSVSGNLKLESAQTYATTLSDFTLAVTPDDRYRSGTLTFAGNGQPAGAVYAAGGSVTGLAPYIVQNGRLAAPFGGIYLGDANTISVSYGDGSVTTVAGAGEVPFGSVANPSVPGAAAWKVPLYDGGTGGSQVVIGPDGTRPLPEKQIMTRAQQIDVAPGATIDASGGGKLTAYAFTAGKGGSHDILDSGRAAGAKDTVFAILPGYAGDVTPVDGAGSGGLEAGDKVYLSGMPGLPAGTYTLLPAHFALLPGAYAVQVASGTAAMSVQGNVVLQDGAMLMAGRLEQAGSGSFGRTLGFVVQSGKTIRSKSEFANFDAATFFKPQDAGAVLPELPADGGYLRWQVNNAQGGLTALSLRGTLRLGAGSGGRAGFADFTAPSITIVGDASQATGGVTLAAGQLSALGADSILIGALRDERADGMHLDSLAQTVTLSNSSAQPLSAPDVTLAASGTVRLAPGAALSGNGAPARPSVDLALAHDGALLRVSGGAQVDVARADATVADAGKPLAGTLDIAAGATVAASGSAYLDAAGKANLGGTLKLAPGAALAVGARGIDLGSAVPDAGGSGVQFDSTGLAQLNTLSALELNSYDKAINLYGDVTLGGPALNSLILKGAGIAGYGSVLAPQSRRATLTANVIRLEGGASGAMQPADGDAGSLRLQAGRIDVGSGNFQLAGYGDNVLAATGEIVADGKAGIVAADAGLTLTASRITANAGAAAGFLAGGTLTLTTNGTPVPVRTPGLGGTLGFGGANIVSDATIVAPAGRIAFSTPGQLALKGGQVSVAGTAVDYGNAAESAPGGTLSLSGMRVDVAPGAVLDVSADGAAAGTLAVSAGTLHLDGVLRGQAASADGQVLEQGKFSLDVDRIDADAFARLNQRLNESGFTESRRVTAHQGDLALGNGGRIVAHDVMLAADDGNVSVTGTAVIDASGAQGGTIELYAGQATPDGAAGSVRVAGDARLSANATGSASGDAGAVGNGGRVVIGISNRAGAQAGSADGGGAIRLEGGTIDVSGATAARNGSVLLRAPRVADATGSAAGRDVAVARLDTRIQGSGDTAIDAYQVYDASRISEQADGNGNLNAGKAGQMYTEAAGFMAATGDLTRRLGAGANGVRVTPGVEVRSSGDLTVSVNELATNAADRGWNLQDWRFDGAPLALTLRSAGNLTIAGSISDGFVKPSAPTLAMPDWSLANGMSASYRLVGGALTEAANPLAVGTGGDVLFTFADRKPTLTDAPVAVVRTGAGRIDIAAGRDVTLGLAKFWRNSGTPDVNDTAALGTNLFGAAVYTAGQASALPAGFDAPKNQLNTQYGAAGPTRDDAGTQTAAAFGMGGGGITISAGRDVNGPHFATLADRTYHLPGTAAVDPDPTVRGDKGTPAQPGDLDYLPGAVPQLTNNWLFRQGRTWLDENGKPVYETLADGTVLKTAWWTRYDYFNQGVATFGGGNVDVRAGRSLIDFSASVATSAFATGAPGDPLRELGGGDLRIRAGGDILGGSFYVQKGTGSVHADGSMGAGHASYSPFTPDAHALKPILALGDARFYVSAGGDLGIEGIYNPTMTAQTLINRGLGSSFKGLDGAGGNGVTPFWHQQQLTPEDADAAAAYRARYGQYSSFSTYRADSGVTLTSVGGDVRLSNDVDALSRAGVAKDKNATSLDTAAELAPLYSLAPATLKVAALSGNVALDHGLVLASAPSGQLDLLAAGNVSLKGGTVRMLDNDPAATSTAGTPRVPNGTDLGMLSGESSGIALHTLGTLHAADATPVHVIARDGDLLGDVGQGVSLDLAKTAVLQAGRDIRDLGFRVQLARPDDVLTVRAGRDFIDSTPISPSDVAHVVTGSGRVDLSTGRDIDLGFGHGLVTRGNLDNAYLPEGGASIRMVAGGVTPDYAKLQAYASAFGLVADVGTGPDLDALRALVLAKTPTLAQDAPAGALWVAFRALPAADQKAFLAAHPDSAARLRAAGAALKAALDRGDVGALDQALFSGLVETSQDKKLAAFDALIASLFPGAAGAGAGNIALYNSQIKTEQGGSIDLFAPTGSIYAGLTAGSLQRKPSELGIFTIRGGAVSALVEKDFLVNQGRVFTLGGGDITLVSHHGGINAGRGAKTAASAPPPAVIIDANGNVKLDVSGSIAGAGIATLRTSPNVPPADVFLVAPGGPVDGGDGGVRSSGNLKLEAKSVLNASNFTAAGTISGAPVPVSAPSIGAPVMPASTSRADDVAGAVTKADGEARQGALDVEVLGYGEDDADDEDARKKKRRGQDKPPAAQTQSAN